MTNEMIERVARTLFPEDFDWHRHGDDCEDCRNARDEARSKARAAIEAMRVPTPAMIDAAATVDRYAEPGEEWAPMIDAALK